VVPSSGRPIEHRCRATLKHYRNGELIGEQMNHNKVTDEGINKAFKAHFKNIGGGIDLYVVVTDGTAAVASTTSPSYNAAGHYASYNASTIPSASEWLPPTATAKALVGPDISLDVHDTTADTLDPQTVGGVALKTVNAFNTGVMIGAVVFGDVVLESGDSITVQYTLEVA